MARLTLRYSTDTINFELIENNFVLNRWTRLLEEEVAAKAIEYVIAGTNDPLNNLIRTIQEIHVFRPGTIPERFNKDSFTRDELGDLHAIFEEKFKDPDWQRDPRGGPYLNQLNDYIHATESMLRNDGTARIRIRFQERDTGNLKHKLVPLEPEDFSLFQPYLSKRVLFLNYYGPGRDYLATFRAKRPIEEAVPQVLFTASFFFYLKYHNREKQVFEQIRFAEWMKQHGLDVSPGNSCTYIPIATMIEEDKDYASIVTQQLVGIEVER